MCAWRSLSPISLGGLGWLRSMSWLAGSTLKWCLQGGRWGGGLRIRGWQAARKGPQKAVSMPLQRATLASLTLAPHRPSCPQAPGRLSGPPALAPAAAGCWKLQRRAVTETEMGSRCGCVHAIGMQAGGGCQRTSKYGRRAADDKRRAASSWPGGRSEPIAAHAPWHAPPAAFSIGLGISRSPSMPAGLPLVVVVVCQGGCLPGELSHRLAAALNV